MATSGPRSASTESNDNSFGTQAWLLPGGAGTIFTSNDQGPFASNGTLGSEQSNYLVGGGFGFSIPDDDAILGVKVELRRAQFVGASDTVKDHTIRLLLPDGSVSNNKADVGTTWPNYPAFAYASYGGDSDTWGLTLTSTIVNSADFRVRMAVTLTDNGESASAFVDHVRVTIYHGTAPVVASTRTSDGKSF